MTVQDSAARLVLERGVGNKRKWEFPNWYILGATRPKEGIPMTSILAGVHFAVKEKLCKQLRRCCNAGVRVRYLIVINLLNRRTARQTAEALGVHTTTVYRVAR